MFICTMAGIICNNWNFFLLCITEVNEIWWQYNENVKALKCLNSDKVK